ncbi:hypothetical protein LUZ60_007779 [Juncus effusus]|nr:hypothetical protein LUZ60_007779 [Juncus effusus]
MALDHNHTMDFAFGRYPQNRDLESRFPSFHNGPAMNNCSIIDMCCGAADPFGMLMSDPGMMMSDPVSRLPPDPFGMNHPAFNASFFAEPAGRNQESAFFAEPSKRNQESTFFTGFDNWMIQMKAHPSEDYMSIDPLMESFSYYLKNQSFCTDFNAPPVRREALNSRTAIDEFPQFSEFSNPNNQQIEEFPQFPEFSQSSNPNNDNQEGSVHEGMYYVLGYLGVKDLLNMKRVCKSIYQAVESDPLLWREILIDSALSEKITDEKLLEITGKAQGNLKSLILNSCTRITDEGLKRVVETNPKITTLFVPECMRLNLETLIETLKTLKSSGNGIKHLKLGRLVQVSDSQFQTLQTLLSNPPHQKPHSPTPRFFHTARDPRSNADRALDIEPCPLCRKLKLVYDCSVCEERKCGRACESCVLRCMLCGKCIRDESYVETFSLECVCTACLK